MNTILAACALFATLVAPVVPPTSAGPAAKTPAKVKVTQAQAVPIPVRLRMSLRVVHTTDMAEAGISFPPSSSQVLSLGNTEDEIYYTIAKLPYGSEPVQIKTKRPSGSPDIWEMGLRSLPELERVLFEGQVAGGQQEHFAVAIGEQDNAQIETLSLLFGDIAGFIAGLAVDPQGGDLDAFEPAARATVDRIRTKGDDVVGFFIVSVGPGRKISVETSGATFGEVLSSSTKEVTLKLTGKGAVYNARLWVEAPSEPVPKGRKVAGKTSDKCSHQDLWVVGDAGQVLVKKGERKDVPIGPGTFTWYCGGSEESAGADAGTDVVNVRRAMTGRNIDWVFFRENTLVPDFH